MSLDATIVENVPRDATLTCEEVFGYANDIFCFWFLKWYQGLTTYPSFLSPVCTLEKYSDFKDVVKQINSSRFGLQGGLFTQNFDRAFYGYEHLEMGGVVINDVPSVRVESQPVRVSFQSLFVPPF